jgi:hypothetical protein
MQALKKASARLPKAIIENSDEGIVLVMAELALNVLNGTSKISRCGAERLRKHKIVIRELVDKGIAFGKKKKLQRGGFLLPLLTAAFSVLPSLIQL